MRSSSLFLALTAIGLVGVSGCASTRSSSSGANASAPAAVHPTPARRDSKLILLDEIRASGAATAFDLVQSLRPMWLNKRGPQSIQNEGEVHVYVGDTRMGDVDALREIAAASIASIRYLDAKEANYKFGQGHPYGAIVISTVFPPNP